MGIRRYTATPTYTVDVDAVKKEYTAFASNPVHTTFFTQLESDREHAVERMKYSEAMLKNVPKRLWGAFSGGGCHFRKEEELPEAMRLTEGKTVVDFGSGLGMDCMIAASMVGPSGKVIGLDFTPKMLEVSRDLARECGHENCEFLSQKLDDPFPAFDFTGKVDRVISNGVINLCVDKAMVFKNAFDLLRPGGVMMYSDFIVLPDGWQPAEGEVEVVDHANAEASWIDWVAGCVTIQENKALLSDAGFINPSLEGWNDCYTSLITRGGIMVAEKPLWDLSRIWLDLPGRGCMTGSE